MRRIWAECIWKWHDSDDSNEHDCHLTGRDHQVHVMPAREARDEIQSASSPLQRLVSHLLSEDDVLTLLQCDSPNIAQDTEQHASICMTYGLNTCMHEILWEIGDVATSRHDTVIGACKAWSLSKQGTISFASTLVIRSYSIIDTTSSISSAHQRGTLHYVRGRRPWRYRRVRYR